MFKRALALFVLIAAGVLTFSAVSAQDATVEPSTNVEYTIADIVANKDQYYGQEVTTEGVITDLINIRAFVLSDGNSVGGNELLVINNSGSEFDLAIKNDQRVRLTGTLYRDFNSGGWNELAGASTVNGDSPMAVDNTGMTATQDMTMATTAPDMLATEDMTMATTAPDMLATEDMAMPTLVPDSTVSTDNTMQTAGFDLSQMYIPDNLRGHTILVLTSLDTITYIQDQ